MQGDKEAYCICSTLPIKKGAAVVVLLHLAACFAAFSYLIPESGSGCSVNLAAVVVIFLTFLACGFGMKGVADEHDAYLCVFFIAQVLILNVVITTSGGQYFRLANGASKLVISPIAFFIFVYTYCGSMIIIGKFWEIAYRRRTAMERIKSKDLQIITPEVRVFDPTGSCQLLLRSSPVPVEFDSVRCDSPCEGSPNVFDSYAPNYLR